MPITRKPWIRRACLLGSGFLIVISSVALHAAEHAGVAVVHTVSWSPGDVVRDGADELSVLMSLARVQHEHRLAGLVGIGDTHGVFQNGEERALRFAALSGVPVVKVGASENVVHCPDDLFIEVGGVPEAEACRLLATALEHCGAPPRALNPTHPTADELSAIAHHVQRLRQEMIFARGIQLTQDERPTKARL
jgi:hypothetical protein